MDVESIINANVKIQYITELKITSQMKIGIIHFTDIHIEEHTDLEEKLPSCLNAIKNDLYGVQCIYFVLGGDIAFSGKSIEYAIAKRYFNLMKQLIERHFSLKVKMIVVPGNHDCDFSKNTQNRTNSIRNINYEIIGTDDSVIDSCLTVQEDFWEFYSQYNDVPSDKLYYPITDQVNGVNITFHCINTAWVSQLEEKPGSLFFPVKKYFANMINIPGVNLGVFHHPYNWFNPNTVENNKKEFERLTEKIASIHFVGHEHENEYYNTENILSGDKIQLLAGKVFNESKNSKNSGFETIVCDVTTNVGELKIYSWEQNFYNSIYTKSIALKESQNRKFEVNDSFLKSLNEIKIPFTIGDKKQVRLSEMFTFPDIEALGADAKVFDNYKDAIGLLGEDFSYCVISGDDQIGKTSLLNIVYQKKYNQDIYPILINGKDIKELHLVRILKKAFKQQYNNDENGFERFSQLEIKDRVLLIDDYQNCSLSAASVYPLLQEAKSKFGKVIITINAEHSMLAIIQTEFKDFDFFRIKPLGYSKRNSLIEQYNYLKSIYYNRVQDDTSVIKEYFDKVTAVLGDKLIPAYPIYVLSILQALDYNSLKQNETSFGYCYQTLIHLALHKAGVKNDDMDTYFNLLSELAYEFIRKDVEIFNEAEMLTFFIEYKKRFICPNYETVIKVLKDSRILILSENEVYFGYDYILYYLSAKKIADLILTTEGKNIISKLFANIHLEKNGNILVFITHHCKDISFIEESLLQSMMVLSDFPPITLALDDPFYVHIKEIVSNVSKDILEINKNAKEEREKQLLALDQQNHSTKNFENDESEDLSEHMNALILPFKQSFRAIEIVGQIVRNRKGSLEIPQLKEMIREIYITGFRTISYNSELLIAAKNQVILALNDEKLVVKSKEEIEKNVKAFVMMSSYEACLGIFGKLGNAMGIKDLKHIFNEVSDEMKSPAAKLVSFGINSYYGSITESELKTIIKELNGNPVALKILRSRVKSYVYSRNLPIQTKQKFASLLGMSISPQRPRTKKS